MPEKRIPQPLFRTIVFAADFSDRSREAFDVACLMARVEAARLIVLHVLDSDKLDAAIEKFAANDLPPLWKPRANQFYKIDAIPYLGTGKLDLRKIKELAQQMAGDSVGAAG